MRRSLEEARRNIDRMNMALAEVGEPPVDYGKLIEFDHTGWTVSYRPGDGDTAAQRKALALVLLNDPYNKGFMTCTRHRKTATSKSCGMVTLTEVIRDPLGADCGWP